ncbi:GIY-YIG nuclease family protein [Microbacteriaceae bacterium VKM Ac-2855]|nr:GIY-YIG nuclease family protein [Microbacteriaceae bacterium VKM Ac-2855]
MTTCCADGCAYPAEVGAPAPLCARHLALAHDWHEREYGADDLLPAPCPACGARTGVRYASGWLCAVCEWRFGEVPADDLAPPRVDVVYYIRFDERIKIGTTANPRQRLGRLWHEELLAFERGDRAVERRRHEQFASHRLERSEWFARHEALDAHIRTLAAGHPDPWALHARWRSEALAARG